MKSLTNLFKLSAITLALSTSVIASDTAQFSDSFGEVDVNTDYMTSYVFDETDISSDKVNLNGSKIEILEAGVYQVNYSLSWRTTNNGRRQIQTAILINGTDLASQSYGYARRESTGEFATNNSTIYLELQAGDYVELQHQRFGDNSSIALSNQGESWFGIQYIESIQSNQPEPEPIYHSCKEILDGTQNNAMSGFYTIRPRPGYVEEIDVYCDMETWGGGWTLVMSAVEGYTAGWSTTGAVNSITDSQLPSTSYKLSDFHINSIKRAAYRLSSDNGVTQTRYFKATCEYNHLQFNLTGECLRSYRDPAFNGLKQGTSSEYHAGLSDWSDVDGYSNYITSSNVRDRGWHVGSENSGWRAGNGFSTGLFAEASFTMWVR